MAAEELEPLFGGSSILAKADRQLEPVAAALRWRSGSPWIGGRRYFPGESGFQWVLVCQTPRTLKAAPDLKKQHAQVRVEFQVRCEEELEPLFGGSSILSQVWDLVRNASLSFCADSVARKVATTRRNRVEQ